MIHFPLSDATVYHETKWKIIKKINDFLLHPNPTIHNFRNLLLSFTHLIKFKKIKIIAFIQNILAQLLAKSLKRGK